jgi:hypothetical protein
MSARTPRLTVGQHVVCTVTGRTGELISFGTQPDSCIVRFGGTEEVLDCRKLRAATWDEIRGMSGRNAISPANGSTSK